MSDPQLNAIFVQINKDLNKRIKAQKAERRRISKQINRIDRRLEILHPDKEVLEAVSFLIDDDLVWSGDFDDLRHPIARLMMKAETLGLLRGELKEISAILLFRHK